MNYSQQYFAKPLEELSWADVESFFADGGNENDRGLLFNRLLQDNNYGDFMMLNEINI